MIDILKLIEKTKLKTDREFLELFYNRNFVLSTEKSRMLNSAYKYQDKLGLKIVRRDYSNIHDITLGGGSK